MDKVLIDMYSKEYKRALFMLKSLTANKEEFPKGTIKSKITTKYKDGKAYKSEYKVLCYQHKETYLPNKELQEIERKIAKRKIYNAETRKLKKEIKFFKQKLLRYISLSEIKKLEKEAEMMLKMKIHHETMFSINSNNPDYRIITEFKCLVRYKNEVLFANMAYQKGIIFFYEKAITFKARRENGEPFEICPDFILYIDNNPIYVEILGMMDKENYKENWNRRKLEYKINGIEQGRNLICFSCPDGKEFDCHYLELILDKVTTGYIPKETINLGINRKL